MRYVPIVCSLLLLAACSETPKPETGTSSTSTDTIATAPVVWTGYYTGTLPCADCPGIETMLWVRSDSTFVLQRKYMDRDSVPFGHVGKWSVVHVQGAPPSGLLSFAYAGDPPDHYLATDSGLVFADVINGYDVEEDQAVLEKLADAIGDAIPRMRLVGTFTYMADAQSFKPCGTDYAWPCVGGMDLGEEEGEPLIPFTNIDLQRAYAKAVKQGGDPWVVDVICTMGMGPAMEGDGADEYIFVEQVIGTAGERCTQ